MRERSKKIIVLTAIISAVTVGTVLTFVIYSVYFAPTSDYTLELNVGQYDNAPKIYEDEEGNLIGIWPEILEYIADQERWKLNWIPGTWDECTARLSSGEIDIMVDVAYSDTRAEDWDFNSVEVLNNWGILYVQDGLNIDSIDDLEGKNVATLNGSIHTIGDHGIINLTKQWNVTCNFIELSSYTEVFNMVSNDTAHVGVVNRLFGLFNEENYNVVRTSIMFNPSRLMFAFPKNATLNPTLIPIIDEHLLALQEDTDSMYYQVLDKYIYGRTDLGIPAWVFPLLVIAFGLVTILLSASFMLRKMVANRTDDLKRAHNSLELKVDERTRELSIANERLKGLDQLKSMFIANMSHELRTPLTSIIGFTNIVLKGWAGDVTDEQVKQLSIVFRSANLLLSLINDIIDVSKIETGKIDLMFEEFNYTDLLESLIKTFKLKAKEKGINISLEMPDKLMIKSDKKRCSQILNNLFSNAVKFTDKGEVSITVSQQDEIVTVSVRDTGIGIKKEDIKKLFKPFTRVVAPKEFKEGTGLGLHLSKKLAERIGGSLELESAYGKGSTFTFSLDLRKEVKVDD